MVSRYYTFPDFEFAAVGHHLNHKEDPRRCTRRGSDTRREGNPVDTPSYGLDLTTLHLTAGGHTTRDQGCCLLEAVAWYAGEDHGDRPARVSPVLRDFGIQLNDMLSDTRRQDLVPLVPRLAAGSTGDGLDEVRSYLALDWLVRVWTPTWLDLGGGDLAAEAGRLRDLRRIVDPTTAQEAGSVVRDAHTRAKLLVAWTRLPWTTTDLGWARAWAATGPAAWITAWRRLTEDAVGAVFLVAARNTARAAILFAEGGLEPAAERLQVSAVELYRSMIQPEGGAA